MYKLKITNYWEYKQSPTDIFSGDVPTFPISTWESHLVNGSKLRLDEWNMPHPSIHPSIHPSGGGRRALGRQVGQQLQAVAELPGTHVGAERLGTLRG